MPLAPRRGRGTTGRRPADQGCMLSPDQVPEHIRPCVLCENDATDLGRTVREACASERRGPAKDGCHWSERRQEEVRWKTDTMAMRICWPGRAMCGGLRVGGRGPCNRASWSLRECVGAPVAAASALRARGNASRDASGHTLVTRGHPGTRPLPYAGLSLPHLSLHASVTSLICRRLPRQSCRATAARLQLRGPVRPRRQDKARLEVSPDHLRRTLETTFPSLSSKTQ